MFFPEGQIRVHLYGQPVNMRKSFDGLYALTRHGLPTHSALGPDSPGSQNRSDDVLAASAAVVPADTRAPSSGSASVIVGGDEITYRSQRIACSPWTDPLRGNHPASVRLSSAIDKSATVAAIAPPQADRPYWVNSLSTGRVSFRERRGTSHRSRHDGRKRIDAAANRPSPTARAFTLPNAVDRWGWMELSERSTHGIPCFRGIRARGPRCSLALAHTSRTGA